MALLVVVLSRFRAEAELDNFPVVELGNENIMLGRRRLQESHLRSMRSFIILIRMMMLLRLWRAAAVEGILIYVSRVRTEEAEVAAVIRLISGEDYLF